MPMKKGQASAVGGLYKTILLSGYDADELVKMSRSEYNKALGKKISSEASFKAQKRRINQIIDNTEQVKREYIAKLPVKNQSTVESIDELTHDKFEGIRFKPVVKSSVEKARLTTFEKLTKEQMKAHGISEKKAILKVRALLKAKRKDYKKLNRKDREILEYYGY